MIRKENSWSVVQRGLLCVTSFLYIVLPVSQTLSNISTDCLRVVHSFLCLPFRSFSVQSGIKSFPRHAVQRAGRVQDKRRGGRRAVPRRTVHHRQMSYYCNIMNRMCLCSKTSPGVSERGGVWNLVMRDPHAASCSPHDRKSKRWMESTEVVA